MVLYTPWRVEATSNLAASERLLFYLFFVVILLARSTKVLREGCGGLVWSGYGLLEVGVKAVCEGIGSVVALGEWTAV